MQAKPDAIRLRSSVPADLPAMHALDQICFRNGISYSLEEFEWLANGANIFILVAETSNHSLVGFAVTQKTTRLSILIGHIVTIDIDPAYRRRGLGRKLMQAMEDDLVAHGVHRSVLEVAIDDIGAQNFYNSLGYQATKRLRAYYMNSLDAIVMQKNFPAATKAI